MTTRTRAPRVLLRPQIGQQRADRLKAGALWTGESGDTSGADRGGEGRHGRPCGVPSGCWKGEPALQSTTAARRLPAARARLPQRPPAGPAAPVPRSGQTQVGWVLPALRRAAWPASRRSRPRRRRGHADRPRRAAGDRPRPPRAGLFTAGAARRSTCAPSRTGPVLAAARPRRAAQLRRAGGRRPRQRAGAAGDGLHLWVGPPGGAQAAGSRQARPSRRGRRSGGPDALGDAAEGGGGGGGDPARSGADRRARRAGSATRWSARKACGAICCTATTYTCRKIRARMPSDGEVAEFELWPLPRVLRDGPATPTRSSSTSTWS